MPSRKLWIGLGVVVGVVWLLFMLTFFAVTGDPMVPVFGLFFLLGLANFALVVGSAVHALVRDDLTGAQRIIWLLIVVFVTPGIAVGAIVYLVLGKERTRDLFSDVSLGSRQPPPPPQTPQGDMRSGGEPPRGP